MPTNTPLYPLCQLQLSEKEKQFIWTTILAKQRKKLLLRKLFFVWRVSGYVAVSTFGIFVLISSYLPTTDTYRPLHDTPLFTLFSDNQQLVQADTIGRLLEIQWVVHVLNNWNIVPKTDIAAGEIVVLQPWAELVVQVQATTFATITWPAKFVLEHIPETNQTVLNLLEGKLIHVRTTISPMDPLSSWWAQDISWTAPVNQSSVIIKTKFVEVTPPTDHTTAFVIEQEDKQAEVTATAGNILVKQLVGLTKNQDNETSTELLVDAGKAAHIDTAGMVVYTPSSDTEATLLAAESKWLQIRYQTTPDTTTTPSLTSTQSETQPQTTSSTPTTTLLATLSKTISWVSDKKVLSPDLLAALTQSIHIDIATYNLDQMRQWQYENTNAYIIAYSNLLDQLNHAYSLIWANQPATSTDSLDAGIHIAQNLLSILETTYATPPSLRRALEQIISWLSDLKNTPAPAAEHQAPTDQDPVLPEENTTPPVPWA